MIVATGAAPLELEVLEVLFMSGAGLKPRMSPIFFNTSFASLLPLTNAVTEDEAVSEKVFGKTLRLARVCP